MALGRSNSRKVESPFAVYLRTGYRAAPGVELKFNPWHDTENGRFTFVGQGRYYQNGAYQDRDAERGITQRDREAGARDIRAAYGGRRQPSARDPYVPDYSDASPWHPANWRVYYVKRGDSLTSIARMRKGLTVEYLTGLNRIPTGKLRIGQMLMLPTQRALDEAKDARKKFMELATYRILHDGRDPPDPANPPSVIAQANEIRHHYIANGYNFYTDVTERIQRVRADLYLGDGGRSRYTQINAGKPDRLSSDQGGHIIAVRFNGPRFFFNHFAQDASFNRSAYASLEAGWAALKEAKHSVSVDIHFFYEGLSRRPTTVQVEWWVDGEHHKRIFPNSPKAKLK
ncbi:DNA/RNA non-specific endonuclease [Sphingomonas sp. HITSZ_GF]|uniref:LysM peptidoglycan-binding domain-containing protein n=1 Tax=Sphingomonas sp. HITSZ_GF TaxID=3037247 RepID=UPI00240DD0D8|nr:DNA/RNA non-specific endonuclease [Sphingomonas sp. HITSZ_GF]MDG2534699.1 DNA/RNA non-specific endonuclease [Sphingomonas sp. HITSZ_GF]